MSERRSRVRETPLAQTARTARTAWTARAFWDEVEYEIEAVDLYDFAEFASAAELPIEARPGFEAELRRELLDRVRRRYQQ